MNGDATLRNAFAELNPWVLAAYYGCMLVASATILHPAMLLISIFGALCTAACRMGLLRALKQMAKLLPLALLTALVNPMFSHEGATILGYLPSGNPLTLESIAYGLAAGGMLLSALGWFLSVSAALTGEKWIHLLGGAVPSLSLVLSMIFRFVPKLLRQIHRIGEALALSEPDASRLKRAFHTFSAILTWALEDAAETADAMRCRGYGLPGRSAYARYRMDGRDWLTLLAIALLTAGLVVFVPQYRYFPTFEVQRFSPGMLCYFCLSLLPTVMGGATELRYFFRIRRLRHESAGNS